MQIIGIGYALQIIKAGDRMRRSVLKRISTIAVIRQANQYLLNFFVVLRQHNKYLIY